MVFTLPALASSMRRLKAGRSIILPVILSVYHLVSLALRRGPPVKVWLLAGNILAFAL